MKDKMEMSYPVKSDWRTHRTLTSQAEITYNWYEYNCTTNKYFYSANSGKLIHLSWKVGFNKFILDTAHLFYLVNERLAVY